MKQDQFKERYFIKLISSIIIAVLNIIIQMLLPRSFSVEEYGYYSYNLNVFTSIVSIANLGSEDAMLSKFSKRNDEIGIILFFLKIYGVITILLSVGVLLLGTSSYIKDTFMGQTVTVLLLGLEANLITRLLSDTIGVYDSLAISRYPAVLQIVWKVIIDFFVIVGYLSKKLNLAYFYLSQTLITLVTVVIMLHALFKEQKKRYPLFRSKSSKEYLIEFLDFCKPLIFSRFFSQLMIILMNWSLMNWSGTIQQAMFGAAWQLNTLVGYFFTPFASLSQREFAIASNDINLLRKKYIQALKLIMWIACYFSIFVGFASDWILQIIYGNKYSSASLATLIIMFYTIYQAWGQLSGYFLVAIEKTRVSAFTSICGQIITFICMLIFQIPNILFPVGLGAIGIALTYLVSNYLSVGIGMFYDAKILQISFIKNISIQIMPILICSSTIVLLRTIVNSLWNTNVLSGYVIKVVLVGIMYSFIIFCIIYIRPKLIGLTQEDIKGIVKLKK